jgi:polyhydroxyalkanoate synthesis regulator phasin
MTTSPPPAPTSRWARALALVCLVCVLPVGISGVERAEARPEEGADRVDPRVEEYRALEQTVKAAVAAGEMSEADARKRLELARIHIFGDRKTDRADDGRKRRYEEAAKRIGAAVEAGELTKEQAEKKLIALRKKMWPSKGDSDVKTDDRRAEYAEVKAKIRAAVAAGELTEEEAKAKLAALKKKMWPDRAKGDGSDRIAGAFERMGIGADALARVKTNLRENGFTDEQIGKSLGGILRIAHELKSEGDAFELDPKMQAHLSEKAGLSQEQIDRLVGLARRVMHGRKRGEGEGHGDRRDNDRRDHGERGDDDRGDRGDRKPTPEEKEAVKKRIWAAVEAGKITEEQAQARWEGYLKRFE